MSKDVPQHANIHRFEQFTARVFCLCWLKLECVSTCTKIRLTSLLKDPCCDSRTPCVRLMGITLLLMHAVCVCARISPMSSAKPPRGSLQVPVTNCSSRKRTSLSTSFTNCAKSRFYSSKPRFLNHFRPQCCGVLDSDWPEDADRLSHKSGSTGVSPYEIHIFLNFRSKIASKPTTEDGIQLVLVYVRQDFSHRGAAGELKSVHTF